AASRYRRLTGPFSPRASAPCSVRVVLPFMGVATGRDDGTVPVDDPPLGQGDEPVPTEPEPPDEPDPPDDPEPLKIASTASVTSAAPTAPAAESSREPPGMGRPDIAARFSRAARENFGSGLCSACVNSARARCGSRGTPQPFE